MSTTDLKQTPEYSCKTHSPLSCSWTLWSHLPYDSNWSIESYKNVMSFDTVEAACAIIETLSESMIKNCMFFLMRTGISPIWEDEKNKDGGCFSYKVSHKYINITWKKIVYATVGNTLSANFEIMQNVNGVTISPKKNFCVVKIWMASELHQNPSEFISSIEGIVPTGCTFRKHNVNL
jgi:hypothetical protein